MYKCKKITHHTLQFCQTPVQVIERGIDFVLPLSQEQQQEEPHQNIPEGNVQKIRNLANRLDS